MDKDFVFKMIDNLPSGNQLLFGICCVERILHLYVPYGNLLVHENLKQQKENEDDYDSLKFYLSKAYLFAKSFGSLEKRDIQSVLTRCLKLTPDTDQISDTKVVLAQNVVIALAYLFDFMLRSDVKFIHYCSDKIIESIDIIEPDEEKSCESINKEYLIQRKYSEIISKAVVVNNELIERLKRLNQINQVYIQL